MEWETNVHIYLIFFADGCPEILRPKFCPHCKKEIFMHRHGKYQREVFTLSEQITILIYRFKCPDCQHTVSILPSFIGPHQQVTWDVQEDVVRENSSGKSLKDMVEQENAPFRAYSEKTLWCWKHYWDKLLNRLELPVWELMIKVFPHLTLPVGADKPQCRWNWFFNAFEQVKSYLPDAKQFRPFHWLYRLSKSLSVTVP